MTVATTRITQNLSGKLKDNGVMRSILLQEKFPKVLIVKQVLKLQSLLIRIFALS